MAAVVEDLEELLVEFLGKVKELGAHLTGVMGKELVLAGMVVYRRGRDLDVEDVVEA